MSVGAQIDKFYQEVGANKILWFAECLDGIAVEFDVSENEVTFPIWSSKSRIQRLKKLNPEILGSVTPRAMPWDEFKEHVVPILRETSRLVSLNLSGKNLTGFDLQLEQVIRNIDAATVNSCKN